MNASGANNQPNAPSRQGKPQPTGPVLPAPTTAPPPAPPDQLNGAQPAHKPSIY
jgi:hypothetical protein